MKTSQDSAIYVQTKASTLVVEAKAVWIGNDLLVYIWGGDRPHIGAVAAAQPRPSLADQDKQSATCSVLTYLGHKEDEVVKKVSEQLSAILNTSVVVTAGIHWDQLNKNDISTIKNRVEEIIRLLAGQLIKEERIL